MKAIGVMIVIILMISCSSSRKSVVPNASSSVLDDIVAQKEFLVSSDWASPMASSSLQMIANSGLLPPGNSANMINLTGNSNYVKMVGDSVFGYLPYYGERRMAGAYGGTDTGIIFEGIPEALSIKKDTIKQRHQIYFEISDKNNATESYQVNLTLYPNHNSSMNVTSSHRAPISYDGKVKRVQEKE